jgi:hypothetical protein
LRVLERLSLVQETSEAGELAVEWPLAAVGLLNAEVEPLPFFRAGRLRNGVVRKMLLAEVSRP